MARVCEICGKGTASGSQITYRGLPKKTGGIGLRVTGHTKRKFKANIQRLRVEVDGKPTRMRLCTRCLKSGKVVKPVRRTKTSAA
jgi:large subunit ribosomal protein L28